jgi:thiol-disulfide isomerase/thioredoxin
MLRRSESFRRIGVVLTLGIWLLASTVAFPVRAAEKAPLVFSFSLQTLDGKTLTRDNLKGKVVVLDFWATWCIPCIKGLPELKELRQKNSGRPLVIVSVSGDDSEKTVKDFVTKNRMDWPQVWDGSMKAASAFRVNSLPTYIVLDHEGRIAYRQNGWAPGHTALGAAVSKALDAVPKTPADDVAR